MAVAATERVAAEVAEASMWLVMLVPAAAAVIPKAWFSLRLVLPATATAAEDGATEPGLDLTAGAAVAGVLATMTAEAEVEEEEAPMVGLMALVAARALVEPAVLNWNCEVSSL